MLQDCTTLIVDDQEYNREILCEILKDTGRVIQAQNGEEALHLLEEMGDEIEGIILDLLMPVMDGYAFLERFTAEKKYRNIPVIVATAEDDVAVENRCLQMGAWDMVRKPFNPLTLLLRLNNSVSRSRLQKLEERRWERAISRYAGSAVLQQLKRSGADISEGLLAMRPEDITVLFADIRGFTTLSQQLPPSEIVDILDRFFAKATACIWENDGIVDKYMGDCIMAEWNAMLPCEDQVYKACKTALQMVEQTKEMFLELSEKYGCEIGVGLGVNFGRAVVGNIGTPERMDYTCIGDVVNTAQRLEHAARHNTVYIGSAVAGALGDRAKIVRLDGVQLRSKAPDFAVYRLIELCEGEGNRV